MNRLRLHTPVLLKKSNATLKLLINIFLVIALQFRYEKYIRIHRKIVKKDEGFCFSSIWNRKRKAKSSNRVTAKEEIERKNFETRKI